MFAIMGLPPQTPPTSTRLIAACGVFLPFPPGTQKAPRSPAPPRARYARPRTDAIASFPLRLQVLENKRQGRTLCALCHDPCGAWQRTAKGAPPRARYARPRTDAIASFPLRLQVLEIKSGVRPVAAPPGSLIICRLPPGSSRGFAVV